MQQLWINNSSSWRSRFFNERILKSWRALSVFSSSVIGDFVFVLHTATHGTLEKKNSKKGNCCLFRVVAYFWRFGNASPIFVSLHNRGGFVVLLLYIYILLVVVCSLFSVVCSVCLRLLFVNFGSYVGTQGRGYWDWCTHFGARPCGITSAQCKWDSVTLQIFGSWDMGQGPESRSGSCIYSRILVVVQPLVSLSMFWFCLAPRCCHSTSQSIHYRRRARATRLAGEGSHP